mmetsp:Transcript_27616/g.87527  ORF Transcript_27616/g.87527 Transcript_27616/m.87527 type:complete len:639 (-) Transcript_27616:230-2146(-)
MIAAASLALPPGDADDAVHLAVRGVDHAEGLEELVEVDAVRVVEVDERADVVDAGELHGVRQALVDELAALVELLPRDLPVAVDVEPPEDGLEALAVGVERVHHGAGAFLGGDGLREQRVEAVEEGLVDDGVAVVLERGLRHEVRLEGGPGDHEPRDARHDLFPLRQRHALAVRRRLLEGGHELALLAQHHFPQVRLVGGHEPFDARLLLGAVARDRVPQRVRGRRRHLRRARQQAVRRPLPLREAHERSVVRGVPVVRRREHRGQDAHVIVVEGQVKALAHALVGAHHHAQVVVREELPRHRRAEDDAGAARIGLADVVPHGVRPERVPVELREEPQLALLRVLQLRVVDGHLGGLGHVVDARQALEVLQRDAVAVEEAAVQHDDLALDDRADGQVPEDLDEHGEGEVVVLALHLVLEAVHLADGVLLVVPPVEHDVLRPQSALEGHEDAADLQPHLAAVHEVAVEDVPVLLAGQAALLQDVEQVRDLPVQVADHDERAAAWHLHLADVRHLLQHLVVLPEHLLHALGAQPPALAVHLEHAARRVVADGPARQRVLDGVELVGHAPAHGPAHAGDGDGVQVQRRRAGARRLSVARRVLLHALVVRLLAADVRLHFRRCIPLCHLPRDRRVVFGEEIE